MLVCFELIIIVIFEECCEEFVCCCDFFLLVLCELGFGIVVELEGVFYFYVDISVFGGDVYVFCKYFIEIEYVVFILGLDFGCY